jgi:hypothetical protein
MHEIGDVVVIEMTTDECQVEGFEVGDQVQLMKSPDACDPREMIIKTRGGRAPDALYEVLSRVPHPLNPGIQRCEVKRVS